MTTLSRPSLLALAPLLLGGCMGMSMTPPPAWEQPRLVTQTQAAPLELVLHGQGSLTANERKALVDFRAGYRAAPGDRLQLSYTPDRRDAAIDVADWLSARGLPVAVKADPLLPADTLHLGLWQSRITVPQCGVWGGGNQPDFDNQPWPDFGCSVTRNLGLMIADPADLATPAQLGQTSGEEAATAIQRLRDKHKSDSGSSLGFPDLSNLFGGKK